MVRSAKFSKNDWLEFSLSRLGQNGPEALKVKELCASADKTIGSFYHHFKDQNAFFDALLSYWQKKNTTDVIEALEAQTNADEKAKQLDIVAAALNQKEEIGMRRFAQQNKQAALIVAQVDEIRIGFLQSLYQDRFSISDEEAQLLARLEYAAFVGTQTIWPNGSLEDGQALSQLFQDMVTKKFQ